MATTAQGYGIEATLTDETLHVRALSKLFAFALTGPDGTSEVTIPLSGSTGSAAGIGLSSACRSASSRSGVSSVS